MVPDEHEEVNLSEYDPEEERHRRQQAYNHDEDDDHHGRHGPGVSCGTQ